MKHSQGQREARGTQLSCKCNSRLSLTSLVEVIEVLTAITKIFKTRGMEQ